MINKRLHVFVNFYLYADGTYAKAMDKAVETAAIHGLVPIPDPILKITDMEKEIRRKGHFGVQRERAIKIYDSLIPESHFICIGDPEADPVLKGVLDFCFEYGVERLYGD